jgi:eukaryotic-like serine/threonine-protein kinase
VPEATARITLPDRYRVVRHIANGGMASVWEAHDELLHRRVAVKVLALHLGEDDRARRRFAREARTAAGLSSHPNVVTIYDVGEHDGKSFIVMELVSGGTVADRLRAGEEIPHRVALRWLAEAGSALDAAHEAGIVHRDVKPANMLIDDKGRLALADFGIARLGLEDQITQTGQVLGTAAYISPEQAMGEPSTAASDRYALAVVAFELLTGSKPFTAENFAAQARAHVEDEPPRASELDVDVPPAADRVLARGMAKEPVDRWDSAGAMVRALDDALSAPPPRRRAAAAVLPPTESTRVMGDRTPPPARPARAAAAAGSPRRGWGAGALIALAALLLLVAGAVALMSGGDDPPAERPAARDEPRATATPDETAAPEETATAEPTAEPTEEPTAEPTQEPAAEGDDPAELQLEAYELNQAGRHQEALPVAARAVELCQGSTAIDPCAYALFEYGRALRLTGDPEGAISVLEERKQRFPGDQPQAVNAELKLARQAARGGGGGNGGGNGGGDGDD